MSDANGLQPAVGYFWHLPKTPPEEVIDLIVLRLHADLGELGQRELALETFNLRTKLIPLCHYHLAKLREALALRT